MKSAHIALFLALLLLSSRSSYSSTVTSLQGLHTPYDIIEVSGTFYVSDQDNQRIVALNNRRHTMSTVWTSNTEKPYGLGAVGSTLYVALRSSQRLLAINTTTLATQYIDVSGTQAKDPITLAADALGGLFVGDDITNHISHLSATSLTSTTATEVYHYDQSSLGALTAFDLFVDGAAGLYVADSSHNALIKFNTSTNTQLYALQANSFTPALVSLTAITGSSTYVYAFDGVSGLIYRVDAQTGQQLAVFNMTNVKLDGVKGATMDPDGDGHVFFSESAPYHARSSL